MLARTAGGRFTHTHTSLAPMASPLMTLSTFEPTTATPAKVLAQLPAQLLHVAATFASKDPSKPTINVVHVLRDSEAGRATIEATNGHYAFRCHVPLSEEPGAWWMDCSELWLSREAFIKRPAYGKVTLIREDGEARIYGARKGSALTLLESRPLAGHPCEYASPYPNLAQVWPDDYHCNPGAPIGANAEYLASICKAVTACSENGTVRFAFNAPHTPLHFEAATPEGYLLRFLLMPVELREPRPIGIEPSAWPN